MLCVSEGSLQAFEAQAYRALAPRLDAWLATQLPDWRSVPGPQRAEQLHAMIRQAHESGMQSERDFAVFAHLCVEAGPDWRRMLGHPDLGSLLLDPRWEPEAKLLALDEAIQNARSVK